MLSNTEVIKSLIDIRSYAKATDLFAIDYAIAVLSKLEAQGITDPLNYKFPRPRKPKEDAK